MRLVVGLGNPGAKYETTRHNAGFLAIDRLVEAWKADGPVVKHEGEIYEGRVGGERVMLVKPHTFMNLSGRCVAPLFTFYKCEPGDLTVIHDDLDLKPVSLRLKSGGGAGGHNGLTSIDECLGAGKTGYHRVRVGIGHPASLGLKLSPVDYVLRPFSDDELARLDPLLDRVVQAVERLVRDDVKGAMNEFNRRDPAEAED